MLSPIFRVVVPATTANLGCGYDCLGMALDLWNEISVQISNEHEMTIIGEGSDILPKDSSNLILRGILCAFSSRGIECPPLRIVCTNNIPLARGLGSSSAAICGGIFAGAIILEYLVKENKAKLSNERILKEMKQIPLTTDNMFQLACDLEGHPDNVSSAIFGGLRVSLQQFDSSLDRSRRKWISEGIEIPIKSINCVLFIPRIKIETKEARGVIPSTIPHEDAVWNVARAAMLVSMFSAASVCEQTSASKAFSCLENFQEALKDKLHQPYRMKQNPHLEPLMEAALAAGAFGVCLSGAGPTVIAFASSGYQKMTSSKPDLITEQVATALKIAAEKIGTNGNVHICKPSLVGVHLQT